MRVCGPMTNCSATGRGIYALSLAVRTPRSRVVSPDRDGGFEPLPTTERARRAFEQSAPVNPYIHLFTSELGPHLLLVDGSRIFDIDADVYADLEIAQMHSNNSSLEALLRQFGLDHRPYVNDEPIISP